MNPNAIPRRGAIYAYDLRPDGVRRIDVTNCVSKEGLQLHAKPPAQPRRAMSSIITALAAVVTLSAVMAGFDVLTRLLDRSKP